MSTMVKHVLMYAVIALLLGAVPTRSLAWPLTGLASVHDEAAGADSGEDSGDGAGDGGSDGGGSDGGSGSDE